MKYTDDDTARARLYLKGLSIRYERRCGLWLTIMWRLALRGHTDAMIELADWFSSDNDAKSFGTPADAFRAFSDHSGSYPHELK